MPVVIAKWADPNLKIFGSRIELLNSRFPKVLPRIVNQVGNRSKTLVIRNLVQQTGLPRKTIVKAVGKPQGASQGKLSYEMVTRGGNIRLKYLRPRETAAGVIAFPFNKRKIYPHAFMRGGKFPDRKTVDKFDGHVMMRIGVGRFITFQRSDVKIPVEMTRGATVAAFKRIAGPLLKERTEAVMQKLLGADG